MPQLTPDPIADDGATYRAPDDEPYPRTRIYLLGEVFVDSCRQVEMDDEARPARPAPAANGGCEVGAQPQPGRGRQHEGTRIRRCQADRT